MKHDIDYFQGCGFIAHHIINDIVSKCGVARAEDVHIYDHNVRQDRPHYSGFIPEANYHEGDICDSSRLSQVLQEVRPVVIFDLVSPPMSEHDLAFYMRVNVEARRALLDLARETRTVKAFVYDSSAGVIHDSYSDLPNADESYPVLFIPQQREPYSHSKAVAETMVLEANGFGPTNSSSGSDEDPRGKWKMHTVSIRQCTPFGPNHAETTNGLVDNARNGKYRFQIGDNTNLMDWTYIENSARAFSLAAQALLIAHESPNPAPDESSRVDGQAFLITNDQPIQFWTFVRMMGAAAGYGVDPKDVRVIPRWLGMTMAFAAEWSTWILSLGRRKTAFTRVGVRYSTINRFHRIDKAKKRLKYLPVISVEEGIRRSVLPLVKTTREHGD
jgi:sterol-4alpha-carboxylate 3-dehydrogenase (decarboxylating)